MPQADGTGQLLPAAGHPLSVKRHFQAVTFCRLTTNTQHETFGCRRWVALHPHPNLVWLHLSF